MADITVTANQVSIVKPFDGENEIVDMIAAEAVTAGQIVYQTTAGKAGLADANASGKQQARGVALKAAAAGQTVPVLKRGFVAGYTLTGLNYDAALYLSDTAGALADAAGTMTVICGRVFALPSANLTKVLWVDFDWLRAWS